MRILTPGLLLAACLPFIVGVGAVFIFANPIKDWIILISAFAVLITALLSQAVKIRSEMVERAVEFRKSNRTDENYQLASQVVADFFRHRNPLTEQEAVELYGSPSPSDKAIVTSIRYLGNVYEEMAVAIKHGEVNPEAIQDYYVGIVTRFYDNTRTVLPIIRNLDYGRNILWKGATSTRSEVWINFENLAKKWKLAHTKLVRKLPS